MANTLKFGNGNWATKEDSVLAYNDENNNFKPLPFDFTRASTATYVDSDGLIKTSRNGEARIDYTDSTDGALLLEPSRSNLATYSEAFDNAAWTHHDVTVVSGQVSPTGNTSAFKLVEGTEISYHQIYLGNVFTPVVNNYYTFSFFAKPAERTVINGILQTYNLIDVKFDLIAKTATVISGLNASGTIKEYSNGWYKCTVSGQSSQVLGAYVNIQLNNGSNNVYNGDGSSGAYIWGAQVEAGSYATSYIPTSGSAVTRVADACTGAGNEQVINSTEGVLYVEGSALADIPDADQYITLGNGARTSPVSLRFSSIGEIIYYHGGLNSADTVSSILNANVDLTQKNKLALRYGATASNCSLFFNGVKQANFGSFVFSALSALDELKFSEDLGGSNFYGNTKDVRVYNTALTDAELITLTT